MNYQITITFQTSPKPFAPGTVAGGVKVTLGESSAIVESLSVAFENVVPGDHLLTIQAIDGNGDNLGVAITEIITVVDESVMIETPDAFNVAVSPMNTWDAINNFDAVSNVDLLAT